MSKKNKNEIIMGCGEVYLLEFKDQEIPEDEIIETDENNIGHSSGGASFEYKPEAYEIINSCGQTVKKFITKEECTFKTGLLTWAMENIALLSTAKYTEDLEKKTRKVTIGGGGSLANVLVRFVHTKENGKKLRLTMIANAGNGFTLDFGSEKETVLDAEFTAISFIKNFLAEFSEEMADDEITPPPESKTKTKAAKK